MLKKILISVISVALVAATLFVDIRLTASDQKTARGAGDFGSYKTTNEGKTIDVADNVSIRLAPDTNLSFSPGKIDSLPKTLTLKLEKGRVWLNSLNSATSATVSFKNVTVEASPGIFDFHAGDEGFIIAAYRRSAQLDILGSKLVIPEGRQMLVKSATMNASANTLRKLHYSKLIKEIPFFNLEKSDTWVDSNLGKDAKFAAVYRTQLQEEIRKTGAKVSSNEDSYAAKAARFLARASEMLTFDPAKKAEKMSRHLFDYFDTGVYDILIGDESGAALWLSRFTELAAAAGPSVQNAAVFAAESRGRLDRLAFATPDDPFYKAKATVAQSLQSDPLDKISFAFEAVLDTASRGSDLDSRTKTEMTLRQFGKSAESAVKGLSAKNAQDLFFANVLLNDFLDRNPYLLTEEFLKIAEALERGYLKLEQNKEIADDQRQFFISEKLKKIGVIKSLLEKKEVAFQDGRGSILLLVDQIDALRPAFSDAAVIAYFDEQIASYSPIISFLRSSSADSLHGSFQENLNDFTTQTREAKKVNELLIDSNGGAKISAARREELAGMVLADLESAGMAEIKITLPEDEAESRVIITGADFEGAPFRGTYDTARKLFSDLQLGAETIPNAIRLENLNQFLLIKLGKIVLPSGVTPEALTESAPQESVLEKVARSTLKAELEKLSIFVDNENIGLEDLESDVIHLRLATLGQGTDAKLFSFDFAQKTSTVSGLKVQTVMGELPVNGTFAIAEVPSRVDELYQRAVFDKQREDELKKLSEEASAAAQDAPES